MKIAGIIIQNRSISRNTEDTFEATYKGRQIYISSNHGLGNPKHDHLTRFNITVTDIKSGMFDVDTYEDLHTIRDAIIEALKGAILIP